MRKRTLAVFVVQISIQGKSLQQSFSALFQCTHSVSAHCPLLSLLRSPVRTLEGSYSSFCLEGCAAACQWQTCLPEKHECAEQSTAHSQQHTEIRACRQETPTAAYSFEDLLMQTPSLTQKQKSCQGSKSLLCVGTTAGRIGSIQLLLLTGVPKTLCSCYVYIVTSNVSQLGCVDCQGSINVRS